MARKRGLLQLWFFYINDIAITIYDVWHINLKTEDHKEYLRLLDLARHWQPWKDCMRDFSISNPKIIILL